MRNTFTHRILAAALLLAAIGAPALLAEDTIYLKSGQEVKAIVLGLEGSEIKVRRRMPEGLVSMSMPINTIERMQLEPLEDQRKALEESSPNALGALEALWLRHEPYLDILDTGAVQVALAVCRELRAKQDRGGALRMITLIEKVLPRVEGNPAQEIALLRYQALAYDELDEPEKAVAAADRIQQIAADMPDSDRAQIEAIQIQAAMARAEASLAQLRQLEKDWPKWDQMPEKRVERQKFIDASLNAYLEPCVFFPHQDERCAEGLFRAAEVFREVSQPEEAELRLKEILSRYPVPAFKDRATKLLAELEKDPDAKTAAGESATEEAPAAEEAGS